MLLSFVPRPFFFSHTALLTMRKFRELPRRLSKQLYDKVDYYAIISKNPLMNECVPKEWEGVNFEDGLICGARAHKNGWLE